MPKRYFDGDPSEKAQRQMTSAEKPETETEATTTETPATEIDEKLEADADGATQKILSAEDDASWESDGERVYPDEDTDEEYDARIESEFKIARVLKVLALTTLVVGVAVVAIAKLTKGRGCGKD